MTTTIRPALESVKVRVLDLLDADARPMTVAEISAKLNPRTLSDGSIRRALRGLVATGEVRREWGAGLLGRPTAKFWTETEGEEV